MIRILLLMLFMMHVHSSNTVSSRTKKLSSDTSYPHYLPFNQFSSVLKFDRYEHYFEQPQEVGTLTSSEQWESEMLKYWNVVSELENYTTRIKPPPPPSSSSLSKSRIDENRAQQLYPFLLCHLDKTSTSGTQRYTHIIDEISKENNSNLDFHVNELPVYNYNVNGNQIIQQAEQVEKEIDEDTIFGACFYGSMSNIMAKSIKGNNIFATPILPDLKIRRGASMTLTNKKNGKNDDANNNQSTKAISVRLSPGVATSDDKILELAYSFVDSFDSLSEDLSESTCSDNTQLTSSTISVSSTDTSTFSYSLEHSKDENEMIRRDECLLYFIEYLSQQPQVLSVERINKTKQLNDVASWIIQGHTEENNRPWFGIGITGEGEFVQLLDSGIDESHCYLRDASGKVTLTTDYDLTEGRIDLTKRKIVQYVSMNTFNGDREDRTSHGTHIAATIAGKRSDDGVIEIEGMVDGISPGVKLAFFDAHNDPVDDSFTIPSDISLLFYFGRQVGARIHSASWGVHINGEYSERVRLIDTYFYDDNDDEFIMFAAAGNDGLEGSRTVIDPSLAKNVISVGASHSDGDDLSNNMLGMDYIAAFSGRGPTADGRIKPDIVAPGASILSAAANTDECDPAVRPKYDPTNKEHGGLVFMSGTSMSCPIAVGAGALVRQYFREEYDLPMDISGTLLKAVLVNGGEALVGRSKSVYGTDFDVSTQYDESQGFGKVNLLNSLKHPDIDSPDLHVEDARVLQQGQTHEYDFEICDSREFRVTIVWKDPPNGAAGCQRCLVNDLDLEVELNEQIYYPNGKSGKDDKNNIERVIIDSSDISNFEQTVHVRVKASNLGYGQVQKYSLASTGCISNDNFVSPTSSPTNSCGDNEFEYVLELFTDRAPEDTSWVLEYQGSGGVINARIAGEYDKRLNTYIEKGCAVYDCFLFVIRDSEFDGLCCVRGMGSYRIIAGNEVLVEGDSFRDRQEIEKFCYYGTDATQPTASPTVVCNDDEFKYQIDIHTDLYPDETRWELRKPRIDGVEPGTYTEKYREYLHEGCLDLDSCVSFSVYGIYGEYTFKTDDFIVADRENFDSVKVEGYCYSGNSNTTPTYGTRTAIVGGTYGDRFDDEHPIWQFGKIVKIEVYESWDAIHFIGITYESGQSFGHGGRSGTLHIISLAEDQYITKVSGKSERKIRELKFETNDGATFSYGYYAFGSHFEFDFARNELVYIFGKADDYYIYQLGFAYASLSPTTPSSTSQPTSLPCDAGQFRYEIVIRTDMFEDHIWWELYQAIDSVTYMTYSKQFENYSHMGCAKFGECYEFQMIDKRRDGLCCYFGSGSYKLSVGNDVLVQGNHFDDAISDGYWQDPDFFVYNKYEFCYDHQSSEVPPSFVVQPTPTPTEMTCGDSEFEYRIRVRTDYYPDWISWELKYSDGTIIESVEKSEYFLRHYEHDHRGCIPLDECYEFYIEAYYSLCCNHGYGGYMIFAKDIVITEGGEWSGMSETKTFCYGPSYSQRSSESTRLRPASYILPSFYPIAVDPICENGSNYGSLCGWWASIGLCNDLSIQDWMLENCASACDNCCMDYWKGRSYFEMECYYFAYYDLCTDNTMFNNVQSYPHDITWQEWMQASCRKSCGTCDMEFIPSPSTLPVVCDDDEFKYEIIITEMDYYYFDWMLYYKYPDLINGYEIPAGFQGNSEKGIFDGKYRRLFPPNYGKYGCAKYSCFRVIASSVYFKMYDVDTDVLLAQTTEQYEEARFCNYALKPQPTTSPINLLMKEAIFTITLSFSITSLHKDEIVSSVSYRSIQKILHRANKEKIDEESQHYNSSVDVEYIFCEEFKCDVSFRVCNGSCQDEVVLEPDFLAFIANTMNQAKVNGLLLLTLKQTGHHMAAEIFDDLMTNNPIEIEFDFEYEAWPTSSPTTPPSSKPVQDCNLPIIIQNLFGFISNIFKPITQGINNTVTNITSSISDVLFGIDPYSSTDNILCKDKMFQLQLDIVTDGSPGKISWELLYDNGTIIDSVGQNTYSECDTSYNHSYCLDTSCFVFHMFDSFAFQGSYNITVGDNLVLVEQDGFLGWKDTKHFCYPPCDDDGMFALQLDLVTDPWPHETSWQLAFENGTLIDSVDEGYYTGLNTSYSHRYCLNDGCYSITFQDHIGDGMCCSYGAGSFKIRVNGDEIIKEGGEFGNNETTSFCYPTDELSCGNCRDKSLFEKIASALSNPTYVLNYIDTVDDDNEISRSPMEDAYHYP